MILKERKEFFYILRKIIFTKGKNSDSIKKNKEKIREKKRKISLKEREKLWEENYEQD